MSLEVFFAVLAIPALGFAAAAPLLPESFSRGAVCRMVLAGISTGAGLGISSLTFFLWLKVLGSCRGYFLFEWASIILLFLFFLRGARPGLDPKKAVCPGPDLCWAGTDWPAYRRGLYAAAVIVFVYALLSFVLISIKNPHGEFDAWAQWNMRARFIFRGEAAGADVFAGIAALPHANYPLLVPLSTARLWKAVGSDTVIAPAAVMTVFTFSTVSMLLAALWILRSRAQGVTAAVVLMGTPFFIRLGASQYVDVALGYFILSVTVLFALYDRRYPDDARLPFLAGMAAALAAWTKNEGFMFLASFIAVELYSIVRLGIGIGGGNEAGVGVGNDGLRKSPRRFLIFLSGLASLLVIVVYYKLSMPASDLVSSRDIMSPEGFKVILGRLGDPSRYPPALKTYAVQIFKFAGGALTVPALAAYCLLMGMDGRRGGGSFRVFIVMLAGCFFVFIATPHDMMWKLAAVRRIYVQLWPAFLFCLFMRLKTPEEVFQGASRGE